MAEVFYVGVDVGTASVRAALVTREGLLKSTAQEPIGIWEPESDHYVQSSTEIWEKCCTVVKVGWFMASVCVIKIYIHPSTAAVWAQIHQHRLMCSFLLIFSMDVNSILAAKEKKAVSSLYMCFNYLKIPSKTYYLIFLPPLHCSLLIISAFSSLHQPSFVIFS